MNEEKICVTLMHKTTQIKVSLSTEENVGKLMKMVESKTKIPETNQKLLFKGICISKTPEKLLKELKIKNGNKVMVIGQVFHPEEEKVINKLQEIEKQVETVKTTITEITETFESIKKGFITDNLKKEALLKISKHSTLCIEKLMKNLEKIDALTINSAYENARTKRKQLVKNLQPLLDKCDRLNADLEKI